MLKIDFVKECDRDDKNYHTNDGEYKADISEQLK